MAMGSNVKFVGIISVRAKVFLILTAMAGIVCGCGQVKEDSQSEKENHTGQVVDAQEDGKTISATQERKGIAGETAKDAEVDFTTLKAENPDIFAWMYIPDTEIDCPVLQHAQEDDFYEYHNAYGEEDRKGAAYIELANLSSMCDFNTIIHCGGGMEGDFADLYQFAEPDFFENHEQMYLYLDGNVLTYEIFAAYEREDTSLLRSYDFTYYSGCQAFLNDLYGIRDFSMNLRKGWEGVTPYHFLVTLTLPREDKGEQFVILAILLEDAAGSIDRVITE